MLGDSIRRRRRNLRERTLTPAPPLHWSRWILAGLLAIPLCFGTGYGLAIFVVFPVPDDEAAAEAVAVPRLIGDSREAAEQALASAGLALGPVMQLPHPTEAAGRVIAQSPVAGQQLHPGAAVRVAISAGRRRAVVPDVVGLPVVEAAAFAEQLGFSVNRREEVAPGQAGVVLSVLPGPGTAHDLPAAITVVVSKPPELMLPDTLRAPATSPVLPVLTDTIPRRRPGRP